MQACYNKNAVDLHEKSVKFRKTRIFHAFLFRSECLFFDTDMSLMWGKGENKYGY